MSEPYHIAIAGLGTVGSGVVRVLQTHAALIAERAGRPIEIVAVNARTPDKKRSVDTSAYTWVSDAAMLADMDQVDAVVELIGGSSGPALELARKCLRSGKAFVTANKAMLAHHGYELAVLAQQHDTSLMYEAAVAGGIPIIKSLREGFAANRIEAVYGILNGTCNYILTEMQDSGRDFSEVLKEAQDKGYAEAGPSFDIDGIDTAHKLCILSALAFGVKPDFERLQIEGIRHITIRDIRFTEELGYKIKLLGSARPVHDRICQSVAPCLVPMDSPISAVDGSLNAVYSKGDFVGTGLAVGRGAGEGPTASAVVADLIDLVRGVHIPPFGIPATALAEGAWSDPGALEARFYVHLTVTDRPGVLADVAAIMRDLNVSIESVLQRGRDPDKPVSIVLTTHAIQQAAIREAGTRIAGLPAVLASPCILRIEDI